MADVVDVCPGEEAGFAQVIWTEPKTLSWPLATALGDGLRRFGREV